MELELFLDPSCVIRREGLGGIAHEGDAASGQAGHVVCGCGAVVNLIGQLLEHAGRGDGPGLQGAADQQHHQLDKHLCLTELALVFTADH